MTKQNIHQNRERIDDLFRDALADHRTQPSANFWKKAGFPLWYRSRKTYLVALAFLALGTAGVFFYNNSGDAILDADLSTANGIIQQSNAEAPIVSALANADQNTNPATEIELEPHTSSIQEQETLETETARQTEKTIVQPANKAKTAFSSGKLSTNKIDFKSSSQPTYFRDNYTLFKMNLLSLNPELLNDYGLEQIAEKNTEKFRLFFKDDYAKKTNAYLSAHITAGITYYQSKQQKNFYSFDATGNVDLYDKLTFELGTGIYNENDNGKYTVDYETFDSVGYYMNVNSFTYDPIQDSLILNTQAENVYDSIRHLTVDNTVNSYTYLQFPIALRYKFIETKRLSFSLRAGSVFMLMLSKKVPEANSAIGGAEILNVTDDTPQRINTAWKYFIGMHINFQMGKKVYLTLEPQYQQYFGTLYQRKSVSELKNPYSIGFRTGLTIKF
jgi:hypothetical protein